MHDLSPIKYARLHRCVQEVFQACLPLLARLRRPCLLLPGPVQAVVKAQRIHLKASEEYEGIWHQDGLQENIVAVCLYYYRVSPELVGGSLEFMDRRPAKEDYWLGGDCEPSEFSQETVKKLLDDLPNCKVKVKEGTLVVFSNYQLVHRVLKMCHEKQDGGNGEATKMASRDFLAFFVVDQKRPLRSTAELMAQPGNAGKSGLNLVDHNKRIELRNRCGREREGDRRRERVGWEVWTDTD